MPDTKDGRERKGKNKRRQLEHRLAERELEMDLEENELPPLDGTGGDLVADEPPDDLPREDLR